MQIVELKLSSLNQEEYKDQVVKCKFIENMKVYVKNLIDNGANVKTAQKEALVTAKIGHIGDEVDTRVRVNRDGKVYVIGETLNKVSIEGSYIVKNPDGEEYILKPEKFITRYEKAGEGFYRPLCDPIKYIIAKEDIAFMAPWGEVMYAVKGATINVSSFDDIYAIQNEAFKSTYKIL